MESMTYLYLCTKAAQSLGLDGEPAPIVVREPETLAPKPGSEHTVLLSQVVDHILLLAVDPASQKDTYLASGHNEIIVASSDSK